MADARRRLDHEARGLQTRDEGVGDGGRAAIRAVDPVGLGGVDDQVHEGHRQDLLEPPLGHSVEEPQSRGDALEPGGRRPLLVDHGAALGMLSDRAR